MFVPLVDILRCVRPHADSWLVASIERAEDRYIIEGTLGCPVCLAEYPIRGGIVYFTDRPGRAPAVGVPSDDEAMRLAAALDLTEARMTAVLYGSTAAHAQLVLGYSPAQLLLLDAPDGMVGGDGASAIVSDTAPFAAASVNAIAIDDTVTDAMFASLRRSLRGGGRLLAPVSVPLPPGFTELARDEDSWVARLDDMATVSAPISIKRRGG
jgi:uncharacterized protein YbaR (Trm112 family)